MTCYAHRPYSNKQTRFCFFSGHFQITFERSNTDQVKGGMIHHQHSHIHFGGYVSETQLFHNITYASIDVVPS